MTTVTQKKRKNRIERGILYFFVIIGIINIAGIIVYGTVDYFLRDAMTIIVIDGDITKPMPVRTDLPWPRGNHLIWNADDADGNNNNNDGGGVAETQGEPSKSLF